VERKIPVSWTNRFKEEWINCGISVKNVELYVVSEKQNVHFKKNGFIQWGLHWTLSFLL